MVFFKTWLKKRAPLTVVNVSTSGVTCWIAGAGDDGWNLYGAEHVSGNGFCAGRVVDRSALETTVFEAVDVVKRASRLRINDVVVLLHGPHLASYDTSVSLDLQGSAVSEEHLNTLSSLSKTPEGIWPVHTFSRGFLINGDPDQRVRNPLGTVAQTLTSNTHTVGVALEPLETLLNTFTTLGLRPTDLLHEGVAAGHACLSPDERKLGVTLVDMGASCTTFTAFFEGECVYTLCVPIGGDAITHDLAQQCDVSLLEAERLKNLFNVFDPDVRLDATLQACALHESAAQIDVSMCAVVHVVRTHTDGFFDMLLDTLETLREKALHPCAKRLVFIGKASHLQGLLPFLKGKLENVHTRLGSAPNKYLDQTELKDPFYGLLGVFSLYLGQKSKTYFENKKKDFFFYRAHAWLKENLWYYLR